jgi:hypothetical protein
VRILSAKCCNLACALFVVASVSFVAYKSFLHDNRNETQLSPSDNQLVLRQISFSTTQLCAQTLHAARLIIVAATSSDDVILEHEHDECTKQARTSSILGSSASTVTDIYRLVVARIFRIYFFQM